MSASCCLVALETSGNQRFIFGTNRLRLNLGASQAVHEAGTTDLRRALRAVGLYRGSMPDTANPADFRAWLRAQPRMEAASAADAVEVVFATSSKALLVVRGPDPTALGRSIVREWTAALLKDAPGLDATGVLSQPFDLAVASAFHAARSALLPAHERARQCRPPPSARFQRLPIAEPCRSSGLPAEHQAKVGEVWEASSELVHRQRHDRNKAVYGRFRHLLAGNETEPTESELESRMDALDRVWGFDWLGVVHADGNGLGLVLADFVRHVDGAEASARVFIDNLREFSLELEECTENAFSKAVTSCFTKDDLRPLVKGTPVLPVVVGGDDLTVVCDGARALRFAETFLDRFEQEVESSPEAAVLRAVAVRAHGVPRIGMCAGVAIIKPHFPFFLAYELAEQLLRSAKQVKSRVMDADGRPLPCAALDYHVVSDSTALDLAEVRARIERAGVRLHGRPYVTSSLARLAGASSDSQTWAARHAISALLDGAALLREGADGDAALPSTQAHALRAALHRSPAEAQALFGQLGRRHKDFGSRWGELYLTDPGPEGGAFTRFQDALELAGLDAQEQP